MIEPSVDCSVRFGHLERECLMVALSPDEVTHAQAGSNLGLHASVRIVAGRFSGDVDVFCDLSDFISLLKEAEDLYKTLRGKAEFWAAEGQIGFTLQGDGRGHITLEGWLSDSCENGNTLRYRLEYDQTLLGHSIAELRQLTQSSCIN